VQSPDPRKWSNQQTFTGLPHPLNGFIRHLNIEKIKKRRSAQDTFHTFAGHHSAESSSPCWPLRPTSSAWIWHL